MKAQLWRTGSGALLHLNGLTVSRSIHLFEREWQAKREFHVTLLGSSCGFDEDAIQRAAQNVRFEVRPRNEFWLLEEAGSSALVQMCEVQGAAEFYSRLPAAVEPPPLHVTLYTANTAKGIGVATRAQLEQLGRELSSEERRELLAVIQS